MEHITCEDNIQILQIINICDKILDYSTDGWYMLKGWQTRDYQKNVKL